MMAGRQAAVPVVIPAQAGTQGEVRVIALGLRFRGDDNGVSLSLVPL
jgi:hypothetical protein